MQESSRRLSGPLFTSPSSFAQDTAPAFSPERHSDGAGASFDPDAARAQAAALAQGAQALAEHMAVLLSDNARLSADGVRRARGEAAWRLRAEEALAAVGPLRERIALIEDKARMLSETNARLEAERGRLTCARSDGAHPLEAVLAGPTAPGTARPQRPAEQPARRRLRNVACRSRPARRHDGV